MYVSSFRFLIRMHMTEVMNNGPVLSNVVSQLLEKIDNISNELLSLLERTSDQVSTYSNITIQELMNGADLWFANDVLVYLKRIRFHFQELLSVLETGDHDYASDFLIQMITAKDQEIAAFMEQNFSFNRTYGWYVKNDITPLLNKSITRLQFVA